MDDGKITFAGSRKLPATLRCSAALAVFGLACLGSCNRSRSSFASSGRLEALTFPDPFDVNVEALDEAPQNSPLIQQVVFEFSAAPNPATVRGDTLPIVDERGVLVPGGYRVNGSVVTFTPALPLRAPRAREDGRLDSGGAGLEPDSAYSILLSPTRFPFLSGYAPDLEDTFPDPTEPGALRVDCSTTDHESDFFRALPTRTPILVSTNPQDGSTGVSPQLHTDPDGLFPREQFVLVYSAPLSPYTENFADFLLADLDDPHDPSGLELGIHVELVANDPDRAVVRVDPSGILALGHLHSLEAPVEMDAIDARDPTSLGRFVAATFTTADTTADPIRDVLVEEFDRRPALEDRELFAMGLLPAEWNRENSGLLQAARAFPGDGELGRFIPAPGDPNEPRTLVLDTSAQQFPLLDGSTPDARPGTVFGGVFEFTDIDIPAGVKLVPSGPHPLVLRATGTVRIGGTISVRGADGTDEYSFDSAVTSVPGGAGIAGGGRGGDGHPLILFPSDSTDLLSLVSPPFGGRGWGSGNEEQIGGVGGQSGMVDGPDGSGLYETDLEITCSELQDAHNNGYKPPGGGGGSLLGIGLVPAHGIGNVLADAQGGYLVRTPAFDGSDFDRLLAGAAGDAVFADGDPDNDFLGGAGEHAAVVAGQGGGAGGSALDSYYCGRWCRADSRSSNDAVCSGEFGDPALFADSVGDARGGGGGAGGGAVVIAAFGSIELLMTARIDAQGGEGGGGEAIGCGNWAGCGAGGSGGAVLFQSGDAITVRSGARIDVNQGRGGWATATTKYITSCNDLSGDHLGSGGDGGLGIVQLRVPAGSTATVEAGAYISAGAHVDPTNVENPAHFDGLSGAVTAWFDMGRTIRRDPPGTKPAYFFSGLDTQGFVETDAKGNVLGADVHCYWPGIVDEGYGDGRYEIGESPKDEWIPPNALVQIEFQGASAIAEGSAEVDPASLTPWSFDPSIAEGLQFLRSRITFHLEGGPSGEPVAPDSRRPGIQSLGPRAEF